MMTTAASRCKADLGIFKQMPIEGMNKAQWPWFPTDYKLTFPDSGSTMEFTLSDDMTLRNGGSPQRPQLPTSQSGCRRRRSCNSHWRALVKISFKP